LSRRDIWELVKETFNHWRKDQAVFLAAALSYFAVFSLAPLMILAIAIAGLVFSEAAAEGIIVHQLSGILGQQVAEAVQGLLINARRSGLGTATVMSVVILFSGASGVFNQLKTALNMIWGIEPAGKRGLRSGLFRAVKKRLIAFAMVVMVGSSLILSFFVDAGLGVIRNALGGVLPLLGNLHLWSAFNFFISFVLLALMSAAVYQFLPDVRIHWNDVWVGALVTSLLISVGRYIISLYFRYSDVGSVYGVAGSIVIVFIGIYYSAMIFLLGAEFTWVYAHKFGSKARKPSGKPEPLKARVQREEGIRRL
jgi:membrane protein